MATPQQNALASFFRSSEAALEDGQESCARAHIAAQRSAETATNVLALDAQVNWLTVAVVEQLKLALLVAKDLEDKRAKLNKQVQTWDTQRAELTDQLDNILDSLGTQHIPPSFHQSSSDSSLFGSQHSNPYEPESEVFYPNVNVKDDKVNGKGVLHSGSQAHGTGASDSSTTSLTRRVRIQIGDGDDFRGTGGVTSPTQSPSATLRGVGMGMLHNAHGRQSMSGFGLTSKEREREEEREKETKRREEKEKLLRDRKRWKTLRDFVDDRAIEEMYESIERERVALEKTLNESLLLSEILRRNVDTIYTSIPIAPPPLSSSHLFRQVGAPIPTFHLPSSYTRLHLRHNAPSPTTQTSQKTPQTPHHMFSPSRIHPHIPQFRTSKPLLDIPSPVTRSPLLSNINNASVPLPIVQATGMPLVAHQAALPHLSATQVQVYQLVRAQEQMSERMAQHLESLAQHYEKMITEYHDAMEGAQFLDEDIEEMKNDENHLPSILGELRSGAEQVEQHHSQLIVMQKTASAQIEQMHNVMRDLELLGEIMTDNLNTQTEIEFRAEDQFLSLQNHLHTISDLHARYIAYQLAFAKLVIELDRRVQYRDAAENMVREMAERLNAMSQEESQLRERFNAEYGASLPEDLCLCVANAPTRWEIVPWEGDVREALPATEHDLLRQARDRVINSDASGAH